MKPTVPTKSLALELAMSRLHESVSRAKRQQTFTTNQQMIEKISQISPTNKIGSLQIKPSISGDAESQKAMPLVNSESFGVDLSKMMLPPICGQGSLIEKIKQLCLENKVDVSDVVMSQATCTSVVTALAGQHAATDSDCTDVTSAEFVPVFFNSNPIQKRVIAVCYSLDGSTNLRVDHMSVPQGATMTAIGRESGNSTALQALEIPNLMAAELEGSHPALFAQLQKCMYSGLC